MRVMLETMRRRRWLVFLWLVGMCGVTACDIVQPAVSRKDREQRAAESEKPVVIGVVDSSPPTTLFLKGIELAVDELNQQGGVLNRRIQILRANDQGDPEVGREIARNFARNPDVVAVIGHLQDRVAIPVSGIYEKQGILFLSPGATDSRLTLFGENFTFRNIPTGEEFGRKLADFVKSQGWQRMVVFYVRQDTHRRLIDSFAAEAKEAGIEIAATRSFFEKETNFQELLANVNKDANFDAILIAGEVPSAGYLIRQARGMNINKPILGTTGLDSPDLWTVAGRTAENTIVATLFDPAQPTRLTRDFVKRFKATYGIEPDLWAAQGYDAVQVVTFVMEKSDSTVPIRLSNTLRFMEPWEGVTGSYQFTTAGDITGKAIFFKQARNGGFEFLARQAEADLPVDPQYVVEDMTLRLPFRLEPALLDPARWDLQEDLELVQQLFIGLTELDPQTYAATPALAKTWEASSDGLVYTFHLRQEQETAFWSDGTPITAQDIVQTIRRNLDPALESPTAYLLYVLKNAEAFNTGELTEPEAIGVRAVDAATVEFTLTEPVPYFPVMVSNPIFWPLPPQAISAPPELWEDLAQVQQLPTSGPYKIVLWEKGNVIILRRNLKFYDAAGVAIAEVRFYILPTRTVAFAMYRDHTLDVLGGAYTGFPLDQIDVVKVDPVLQSQYHNQPGFCTVIYGFNTKRPPTDNVLVRKALAAVVDRRLLIELSTRGSEIPATSFTVPMLFDKGAAPNVAIPFNPIQAQAWLAEAGYPDGQGFPELTILYNTNNPAAYSATAHPLQSFFSYYLHIPVQLMGVKTSDYRKLRQQPETPHLVRFTWCADYPDPNNFLNEVFHPNTSENWIGWDNQEFVSLMEQAMQTRDHEQRQALYTRAEEILCKDEAVILPLYYEVAPILVNPRVKGWYYMPINGQHIRRWSLEK